MKSQFTFMFIIQGEGRGHLSQAIRLKEILEENGQYVKRICFGINSQRASPEYIEKEFNSQDIFYYRSPNFILSKNRKGIRLASSLFYNILRSPVFFRSISGLLRRIKADQPDIIINFYDLLGGIGYYFSGRKVKYYSISHHFLFEHPDFPSIQGFPLQRKLLKLHNYIISAGVKPRLALSFDKQSSFGNTLVLPPLVRKDIMDILTTEKDYTLVYLLNEGLIADLFPVFRNHPDRKFRIFANSRIPEGILPGNVHLQKIDYREFASSLLHCSDVISSSGFETLCEAAFLGKPVFLIPSENHFEQYGNYKDAERAGIAKHFSAYPSSGFTAWKNEKFREWCLSGENLFIDILTR